MLLKQVLALFEILDSPQTSGAMAAKYLQELDPQGKHTIRVVHLEGEQGSTDVIKVFVPGTCGQYAGGEAPTLGIVGQLGGLGARPARMGFVSDGDGALAALAAAAKILEMKQRGDALAGDVFISTHICPDAPVIPHEPVPFMGSPALMESLCQALLRPTDRAITLDGVVCVDTTKGNRLLNQRGIAITPTVKEGYILKVSETLLDLQEYVTGRRPVVMPLSIQDITPYANQLYHMNSILQPSTITAAPTIGLAITAETCVPGCATGASQPADVEDAARFLVETAKAFGRGECRFYDEEEYRRLLALYGPLTHFQTPGEEN